MTETPSAPQAMPSSDELISLAEAAEISGFAQPHLSLLARRGKLWAVKIGRNWLTTREAVKEYMAQDRRPGPKPSR